MAGQSSDPSRGWMLWLYRQKVADGDRVISMGPCIVGCEAESPVERRDCLGLVHCLASGSELCL